MIRAAALAIGLALISAPVQGQGTSLIALQESFEICVWAGVLGIESPDDGAVERSFLACRIEENALYTTLATVMIVPPGGFSMGVPADEAMLRARSRVDQLKAIMKRSMLAPARSTYKNR